MIKKTICLFKKLLFTTENATAAGSSRSNISRLYIFRGGVKKSEITLNYNVSSNIQSFKKNDSTRKSKVKTTFYNRKCRYSRQKNTFVKYKLMGEFY